MSGPAHHTAVQTAVATAPWWADIAKYATGAIVGGTIGLIGTMLGLSNANNLQRERFKREDAGARIRLLSALGDLEIVVDAAARSNFIPDAWRDRLQRLLKALNDDRTATAVSQTVYARTLKAASYAEHILAWLQLPETQVLTDAEIKRVADLSSRRRDLANFYREASREHRREAVQSYSNSVAEDLRDAMDALERYNADASELARTPTPEWQPTDAGILVRTPSTEPSTPSLRERFVRAWCAFKGRN